MFLKLKETLWTMVKLHEDIYKILETVGPK